METVGFNRAKYFVIAAVPEQRKREAISFGASLLWDCISSQSIQLS